MSEEQSRRFRWFALLLVIAWGAVLAAVVSARVAKAQCASGAAQYREVCRLGERHGS